MIRVLAATDEGSPGADTEAHLITIFLCGDVMTGRGIDQVLPHPGDPRLYEPYVRSAIQYVDLAERVNGPIPRPVDPAYIWGEALDVLAQRSPDARIVNLETAVTKSDDAWPGKGIHYRMHPKNVGCLTEFGIDCCVAANNHVLDWGYRGLDETTRVLGAAGMKTTGAGTSLREAEAPAVIDADSRGRVIVFALGSESAGVPAEWAATDHKAGVNLLRDWSTGSVNHIAELVGAVKRPGDVAVASIHWGPNWGYAIDPAHIRFAHQLIDQAGVDIIHGHSSHHAKGIEIYKGKPVLYGCGDFVNDYEGIGGYEQYRGDLGLMYFVTMHTASGQLRELTMVPTQMRRFQVRRAGKNDAKWLERKLNAQSELFGNRTRLNADDTLSLDWTTE